MALLIAGVLLWTLAHLFKRWFPHARAKLGSAGRGIMAIAIVASLVLMLLGYGHAQGAVLWVVGGDWLLVSHGLSLFALYLMASSVGKTWITTKVAHPQLTAVKSWSVGHLLINGDVQSLILFGGLLVWAALSVTVINKQDGKPSPVVTVTALNEVVTAVAAILAFGGIAFIHIALGYAVYIP